MRVLLIGHGFPPHGIAGVERVMQTLAAELVRGGDLVSIVCRRPEGKGRPSGVLRERLPSGTMIYRLAGEGIRLDRVLSSNQELEHLLNSVLAEVNPDVVHIHHLLGFPLRWFRTVRALRIPVVLSLHDFYFACPLAHLQTPEGQLCAGPRGGMECAAKCFRHQGATAALRWGLRATYFRRFLRLVDKVVCPSDYSAGYFKQFGADPTRLTVIPNGTSIERLPRRGSTRGRSKGQPQPPLRLAYLGTVVRHKGPHIIVEALECADLKRVDLRLIGQLVDEAYANELHEHAARVSGLSFRAHGAYAPSGVRQLLQGVDCVIVPSQVPESFSVTLREAFASGVPVVAARLGALPEAIDEGKNGYTFAHDEPAELASILRRLTEDRQTLSRLAQGARRTAVMSSADHATEVRSIYEQVVTSRAEESPTLAADEEELSTLGDLMSLADRSLQSVVVGESAIGGDPRHVVS